MNYLYSLKQLGEEGGLPSVEGFGVCFYSKVSIHHITAWFPDQLKMSPRCFFFKGINHGCLLATHDLLILASSIHLV